MVLYYITYGALYLISLLPLRVLYLISNLANFILVHIIHYRRDIVAANLKLAFPEKSDAERKQIARKFYRNFTDNFIEFIKLMSASPRYINKHLSGNYDLLNKFYEEGKKGQMLVAHTFNWEWACLAFPLNMQFDILVVYMPIKSKLVDKIFLKVRTRTNLILLPATDLRHAMMPYRSSKSLLVLVADQNPGDPAKAYWVNFFNKATPFVKGPESGARQTNSFTVFCKFTKIKRGYYDIRFELFEKGINEAKRGDLTKAYVEYLERVIREEPEIWLWSHRRWKWNWKEEYGPVL